MRLAASVVAAATALAPPLAANAQQPSPQQQPSPAWDRLPRMQLERQFAGPLQDTIVQRWRDPVDGTICYIYLPITAAHTPPTASGYVQYGANTSVRSAACRRSRARPTARRRRRRNSRSVRLLAGQRAITSTSRSTPLTTRNSPS